MSPALSPAPSRALFRAVFRGRSHRLAALLVLVLSCVVLLVAPPSARAASTTGPSGPTRHQETVVLGLIDDICGDTWCEGDHAFQFRAFRCDAAAATCRLSVRIAAYSDGPLRWYGRAGEVRGFVRFREMVATAPDGRRSLTPAFYAAVSDLVTALEATVPTSASGLPGMPGLVTVGAPTP